MNRPFSPTDLHYTGSSSTFDDVEEFLEHVDNTWLAHDITVTTLLLTAVMVTTVTGHWKSVTLDFKWRPPLFISVVLWSLFILI